jgi:hypothetical protein
MKYRKLVYVVLLLAALTITLIYLGWLPIVIDEPVTNSKLRTQIQKGDTLSLFSDFNFDDGEWQAFVVFSKEDQAHLPPTIPRATCLQTSDNQLLRRIKEKWRFTVSGGDMATVTSGFYLQRNGETVFSSGLVLDSTIQGFQNREFGWADAVPGCYISDEIMEFHRVWLIIKFI